MTVKLASDKELNAMNDHIEIVDSGLAPIGGGKHESKQLMIKWNRLEAKLAWSQASFGPLEQWFEELSSGVERFDGVTDHQQSESSVVESTLEQNGTSDFSSSITNLLKNHNMYPQLERLRKTNPQLLHYLSNKEGHVLNDIMQNMVSSNQANETTEPDVNQTGKQASLQPEIGQPYSIDDLKRYYEQTKKNDERRPDQYSGTYQSNLNQQWSPLISTKIDEKEEVETPQWTTPFSDSRITYETPLSLANFYVESDQNMHAYETQHTDHKESKELNSHGSTVKDLISTAKDVKKATFKQGNYLPAQDGKFQEYLTCCEQLFHKYGNKNYLHEDVYIIPKGFNYQQRAGPLLMGHPPGRHMPHVSYLRGFPLVGPQGKMPLISTVKEVEPGKAGVECVEEHHSHHPHHSGPHHLMPMYHASHMPPPIFRPPPPGVLLTKKLLFLGKKYLFG